MKKKEVKEEVSNTPIIYYILLFLTVLSTLLIGYSGFKRIELGKQYADVISSNGAGDDYVVFYRDLYQEEGIYQIGLAGLTLLIGSYAISKCKK